MASSLPSPSSGWHALDTVWTSGVALASNAVIASTTKEDGTERHAARVGRTHARTHQARTAVSWALEPSTLTLGQLQGKELVEHSSTGARR